MKPVVTRKGATRERRAEGRLGIVRSWVSGSGEVVRRSGGRAVAE